MRRAREKVACEGDEHLAPWNVEGKRGREERVSERMTDEKSTKRGSEWTSSRKLTPEDHRAGSQRGVESGGSRELREQVLLRSFR